jgi:hypothetical protein
MEISAENDETQAGMEVPGEDIAALVTSLQVAMTRRALLAGEPSVHVLGGCRSSLTKRWLFSSPALLCDVCGALAQRVLCEK